MRVYDPDGQSDFRTVMTKVTTDKVWAEPARMTARAFTKAGQQAYIYLFSYVPAPMRERMQGAPHASEIPYVFGTLDTRWSAESASPEDQAISSLMNSYWIRFAKTGDPNGAGLPEWRSIARRRNVLSSSGWMALPRGKRMGKRIGWT